MKKALKSLTNHLKLFGLKGALRRASILAGRSDEFHANIPRSSKKVLLRLGTTDVAAYEHVFIGDEYGFSLAKEPSLIIDAGANVGMSAVYFALRYPGAKILAVEPELSSFAVLKRNAEMFANIVPVNAALWNRRCILQLQSGGAGHWGMRVVEDDGSLDSGVQATTLPELLKEHELEHVDLLKVDVEGAECEIFGDALSWMSKVSVICVELHDRFRPGCKTIFESATSDFPLRWQRGELHCVAREGWTT